METKNRSLFIIPCCKSKASGGQTHRSFADPLQDLIPQRTYRELLSARKLVLDRIREDPRYLREKYEPNSHIENGPEFGTFPPTGQYLPAVRRYVGNLYDGHPALADSIERHLDNPNKPRVLILSALYGPLHPSSLIQDYNLQISDRPAYKPWKKNFPVFLEEYVRGSGIREIRLYLGGSTTYLKVAAAAVELLKREGLVDRVVQYDVKNGNSYRTPTIHGRLALAHLEGRTDQQAEDAVVTIEL
jgi:hypothetical protein